MRIFDLHCDTVDALALRDVSATFSDQLGNATTGDLADNSLHLAGNRMRAVSDGWAQCYAVWVPDDLTGTGLSPLGFYDRCQHYFAGQMEAHPDVFAQARHAGDVEQALSAGKVAALLTVENATPVTSLDVLDPLSAGKVAALLTVENATPVTSLDVLDRMAADGVRMITLTWNGANQIAGGAQEPGGLTSFGKQVVRRMGELGITVDVSHLSDQGLADVLVATDAPLVASHSNARAMCNHPRNLTDSQFRAIAERGGLVGINYYRAFIREMSEGEAASPTDELSAHIEHFLDLGGEKVLALGSDFDGSEVPAWLDGCEQVPSLIDRLASRFGADIAHGIAYDNAASFFD